MVSARGRIISNQVSPSLRRVRREIAKVPNQALKVFKENTPIDKGNARRKTRLKGETIEANYPYAQRLDDGYSKQSPEGMVAPTVRFIKDRLTQIFKRG